MTRNPCVATAFGALAMTLLAPRISAQAQAWEAPSPTDAVLIDTMALRAHTYFLAHEALAGRGTGSPGEHMAAAYLEAQLRALGLRGPLVGGSYLQEVPLVRADVDTAGTSIQLLDDGSPARTFHTPRDFVVNTGGREAFRSFRGEAVFLGTPEDALRLLDHSIETLSGAVPVVVGPLGAAAARLIPAWREAGAAGVLLLVPDRERFALFARSRGEARFFVDAPLNEPIWQPDLPVVLAGPELSESLLEGTDRGRGANLDGPSRLDLEVRASIEIVEESVRAANVLGLLPGSDPERRDEIVVYTAHYDHLGISTPDEAGDSIYNGFSDNAAGTAMLLAVARRLVEDRPARSVLFAFFTGEERGLLGSSYFVSAPPLPLGRMVGAINLDAGAPPLPPVTWRIAGGTVSRLGALAADVATRHGWTANLGDPSPNSDYWPFLTHGVPAVFIIPGDVWEGADDAERDGLRARWDRYHQAGDEWHPDFPFAGLARYARYALEVGVALANAP